MHLRKLAWLAPLLMAVATAQAAANGANGGFLEPAPLAPSVQADASPAAAPAVKTSSRLNDARPTARGAPTEEPNAPRDLKGLMALVGGLALFGWIQRRRTDA